MTRVLLGVGSNLGQRLRNIEIALRRLGEEGIRICRKSSVYESQPVGSSGQGNFLNCACEAETSHSPTRLLDICQQIEGGLGRLRTSRWAPRTIDIDILYYGRWIIRTPKLTVPHPRIHLRRFVLVPLCEIDPDFVDPLLGLRVSRLLEDCPAFYWVRPAR